MSGRKIPPDVTKYLRKLASKGGKRSLETMTPEERTERAKKAAAKSAAVRAAKKAAREAEEKASKPPAE